MSSAAAKLPAVRLPANLPGSDGEIAGQEALVVELPPASKFSFAWPPDSTPAAPAPLPPLSDRPTSLSSSDAESGLSDSDSSHVGSRTRSEGRRTGGASGRKARGGEEPDLTPTGHPNSEQNPLDSIPPGLPRLSRAFSVPLPSQVSYLKNPRRTPSDSAPNQPPSPHSPAQDMSQLHELSLELADSVQMVIQTLLQLSPPQVFDPAKEQFSACALPIPTPSVSAMFTTMKNLNYMSANIAAFGTSRPRHLGDELHPAIPPPFPSPLIRDFDIGETLQSVGDSLSGLAAEAGVDLVLFHGDVGMKHIAVKGDESGISYTLSHIVRQLLAVAQHGDSLEVGLFLVAPVKLSPGDGDVFSEADTETLLDASDPASMDVTPDPNSPLRCTFQVSHVFAPLESSPDDPDQLAAAVTRTEPSLTSHILHRLIHHIGASFDTESTAVSFTSKLSMTLARGSPAVVNPAIVLADDDPILQTFPDIRISGEPTLEDLANFVDTLKGKKVSLYASSKGLFAQHVTSYLTAWGLDVSHISSVEGSPATTDISLPPFQASDYPPPVNEAFSASLLETLQEQDAPTPASGAAPVLPQPASFILIDDDVAVLRERLRKLRSEQAYPLHIGSRKRPALAAHHRPRSSPQVARAMGMSQASPRSASVIIHFTSLSNFKLVKGILQSVLANNVSAAAKWPEVIVIPKPAGPRRVLTALHTAATRPIVDPFFTPIATSPISPGLYPPPSFMQQVSSPRSPVGRPGGSPRSNAHPSLKSPRDHPLDGSGLAPPSPLGLSEGMDYFSEAAVKLGSSPSSGLVIQSPDGQPAGIFFHPRARMARGSLTSGNLERDKGQAYGLAGRDRSSGRRYSEAAEVSRLRGHSTSYTRQSPAVVGSVPSPRRASNVALDSSSSQPASGASDVEKSGDGLATSPVTLPPRHSVSRTEPPVASPTEVPAVSGTNHPVAVRKTTVETLRKAPSPISSTRSNTAGPSSPIPRKTTSRRSTADSALPAPSPTLAPKKAKAPETSIVPPISVLIVDDNPINQTILSTFMKKKKLKYDVAKNGEEAVNKWKTGRFHLILMDIQMPVMDGIAATKEIRRLEKANAAPSYPTTPSSEGQRTPSEAASEQRASPSPYRSSVIIVALTASSLQSDRVAALAAGCNDFLTKPVSLVWLNSKIIEWGSIKALQMWADIRPDVVKAVVSDQTAQAQNIARRLHVPEGRASPSVPSSHGPSQSITPVSNSMTATSITSLATVIGQPVRPVAVHEPDVIKDSTARGEQIPYTEDSAPSITAQISLSTPALPGKSPVHLPPQCLNEPCRILIDLAYSTRQE
ncbi:hypothetical protein FA95DRAFT_1262942 [Auriscalpium vulgare]|uniref:Uncharacterized protein n=1 Tax=Auriscalpium vulgare TaxID=40419 RepID=A0ACB8RU40_9AGAM|nr:hypothetical protein FA95DRAFT_1262942 [Auriscalpium vulgare]